MDEARLCGSSLPTGPKAFPALGMSRPGLKNPTWLWWDSNPTPSDPQSDALTTALRGPVVVIPNTGACHTGVCRTTLGVCRTTLGVCRTTLGVCRLPYWGSVCRLPQWEYVAYRTGSSMTPTTRGISMSPATLGLYRLPHWEYVAYHTGSISPTTLGVYRLPHWPLGFQTLEHQ